MYFFLFNLQVLSLGVLIAASFAVSAINEAEDLLDPFVSDVYGFDADSYRGAAAGVADFCSLYSISLSCCNDHCPLSLHYICYRKASYNIR